MQSDDISDDDLIFQLYVEYKKLVEDKGWKMDTFYRYLNQKIDKDETFRNILKPLFPYSEIEYDVVIGNRKHLPSTKPKSIKTDGRKINQSKANASKINSGKLGEKIVYDYEKRKLRNLGLLELSKKVKLVSKTDDEDVTFDGFGYDIISYNEKSKKIYIEVKTSITNESDDVIFDISLKEVKFMNGELDNIDKDHCYIYYVSKINTDLIIAEIFIIDNEIFSSYELKATNYKICEKYVGN